MKLLILALCIVAAVADPHWFMLTEDEVGFVKSTFDQVKTHEVDILYAVFKAYPDIQAKFPAFVGKDLDSLKDTAPFALHATRIVSFFGQYISFLGSESTQPAIKTILNEMGSNHKNRGVSKDQFYNFKTAFMSYLKGKVSWGDNIEHAWNDAFDKMYFVIFSNLDGAAVH